MDKKELTKTIKNLELVIKYWKAKSIRQMVDTSTMSKCFYGNYIANTTEEVHKDIKEIVSKYMSSSLTSRTRNPIWVMCQVLFGIVYTPFKIDEDSKTEFTTLVSIGYWISLAEEQINILKLELNNDRSQTITE